KRRQWWTAACQKHLRRESYQLRRERAQAPHIVFTPTVVKFGVAVFGQPELTQTVNECGGASTAFGVILACWHQHPDPPHSIRLLRARSKWPRCCRPAQHSDERPAFHSITSVMEQALTWTHGHTGRHLIARNNNAALINSRSCSSSC